MGKDLAWLWNNCRERGGNQRSTHLSEQRQLFYIPHSIIVIYMMSSVALRSSLLQAINFQTVLIPLSCQSSNLHNGVLLCLWKPQLFQKAPWHNASASRNFYITFTFTNSLHYFIQYNGALWVLVDWGVPNVLSLKPWKSFVLLWQKKFHHLVSKDLQKLSAGFSTWHSSCPLS